VQGADGFYTAVNLIRIPAVSRGTVQGRRAHPYACVHACHACADTARVRKTGGNRSGSTGSGGTGPVRKPPGFFDLWVPLPGGFVNPGYHSLDTRTTGRCGLISVFSDCNCAVPFLHTFEESPLATFASTEMCLVP
jgi:hypothetical protein